MKELIYRPQHKPAQELKDDFVIRLTEFDKVMKSINADQKSKPPQHIIIQGMRGMGKTTLMHRVLYKLQENKEEQGLVPVIFSEEQYSVRKLYKLWEQIALYLDDHEEAYLGIWEEMEESLESDDYEEKSFEVLRRRIEQNKHRLVLLIDNFGVMMDKFSEREQQRLREILITFSGIKIIGGSAVMLESFFRYDKPFFDFFKVIQLNQLSSEEVRTLLLRLAEKKRSDKINEIIAKQPGRIEALRILTGGVPRTIVILVEIFLDDRNGNSIDDLKQLLDDVTPLYKHRMDELPAQQQEIVDKLALNWDGMSVAELAKKTRMESKAVSAQLNVLVKNGVVHAEKSVGKNKYYQLQERFFNIWYLMQHASRNKRKKVIWLTKFLEAWCDGQMLSDIASDFVSRLRLEKLNPEYVKSLTYAYSSLDRLKPEQRDQIIIAAKSVLTDKPEDLPKELQVFQSEFDNLISKTEIDEARKLVNKSSLPQGVENFYVGYLFDKENYIDLAIEYYKKASKRGVREADFNLGLIYHTQFGDLEKATEWYLKAAERDEPEALYNLGYIYYFELGDPKKAEEYYLRAIDLGHIDSLNNLGYIYKQEFGDWIRAKKYFERALVFGDRNAMINMTLLSIERNMIENREKAYKWMIEAQNLKPNAEFYEYARINFLLWSDKVNEIPASLFSFIESSEWADNEELRIFDLLKFSIVKGLHHFIYSLFQKEAFDLKDRYKVLYYALMTLMQDEYPNEIKKMGLELKEPVERMVAEIRAMEKKYSSTEPTPA